MRIPLGLKLVTAFYETRYPGMLDYLFCRFRYDDEVIEACLAKSQSDTIVNLGSGMDPKAYSIPGIEKIHDCEIDHLMGWKLNVWFWLRSDRSVYQCLSGTFLVLGSRHSKPSKPIRD